MIMAEMKSRRPDFQITMVSFRISVDITPDRRKKVASSNFAGAVWTLPN